MTTTFGDLVAVADRHLRAAWRADLSALSPTEHAEVVAALAPCVRAVHLLWRTADRSDRQFRDTDSAWQRAGRELSTGLTVASRCLERIGNGSDHNTSCVPALHLAAARVAIGASHDLLATHTQLTATGLLDRTGVSGEIDSPDGRRAVAAACAQHLPYLATMAEALGAVSAAGRPAREAALRASESLHASDRAIATAGILTRPPLDLLPGIRLVPPLRLHRVCDGESPNELLRQAILGAERLHRVALEELGSGRIERHSPGAMASVSVAMAVSHHITSRVLQHIAPVADLQLARSARNEYTDNLNEAAAASARSAESWGAVREAWRGVRGIREHGPPDVIRTEASDLTTRIGRLAHSDTAWLPKAGASHRLRPVSDFCPNPEETARLLDGLQAMAAASWSVAQDHSRLIVQLASREELLVPTRRLSADFDVPRPWAVAPRYLVGDLRVTLSEAWAAAHDVSRLVGKAHEIQHLPTKLQPIGGGRAEGQARTM